MRWITCIILLIAMIVTIGCGGELEQFAIETVQNAHIELSSAEASGAPEVAKLSHRTAQEMLAAAEASMNAGDMERAYRLALRAYLHARIATQTAIAISEEARVQEAQAQLTLTEQSLAEVLQRLEAKKGDLDALQEPETH